MSIELIAKIKPKNGADFPIVDAADVEMPDGTRLSEFEGALPLPGTAQVGQYLRVLEVDENGKIRAVEAVGSTIHVEPLTQEEYDTLAREGKLDMGSMYVIVRDAP